MDIWLLLQLICFAHTFAYAEICKDSSGTRSCQYWKKTSSFCNRKDSGTYCKMTCGHCTNPTRPPVPSSAPRSCGISGVSQSRIINGVDAKPGAWPWIASLQRYRNHHCGGTLIKPNLVLTASHCVQSTPKYKPSGWSVKLGAHNHKSGESYVQDIKIKKITMHPSYSRKTLLADLAMIELETPAILNNRVRLACLPKKYEYPPVGKQCYLAGWGSIRYPGATHHTLQQVKLPVVESKKCSHQLEVVCVGKGFTNQPNGKQQPNACRGDSGGPLVCQQSDGSWQLEGVASYVHTYCKYYTGYSPVNKYRSWINSFM